MKKALSAFLTLFFITFTIVPQVFASSDYVLPYPSFMPGSKFYIIHKAYENLAQYWYFGDYGSFNYNLNLSDKYLVEAKTLFDYKQYLLGAEALSKSNLYFKKASIKIKKTHKNGTSEKLNILKSAGDKHTEELEKMSDAVPEVFNWSPEKSIPRKLKLKELVLDSINLRKAYE